MTRLREGRSAESAPRSEERRKAIIAAAATQFARKGYDKARIADIARHAGLTDAGVLYHFGTKRALFLAVLGARESPFATLLATPSASVREALDRFSTLVEASATDPEMIIFRVTLTAAAHLEDHPGSDRARYALELSLGVLVPIFAAGLESGELRKGVDPRQSALELLALHDGIRAQWSVLPDQIDYPLTFKTALNNFYSQIREPQGVS